MVFETQSIKIIYKGLRIATTCLQVSGTPGNVLFALLRP